jgi:hypothetical protein
VRARDQADDDRVEEHKRADAVAVAVAVEEEHRVCKGEHGAVHDE